MEPGRLPQGVWGAWLPAIWDTASRPFRTFTLIQSCRACHAKLLQLCPTLCDPMVACQAPLSMGFSRQEYWRGLPCPSPGFLPDPGIRPACLTSDLHWQMGSLPLVPPGKPSIQSCWPLKLSLTCQAALCR